MIIHGDCLVELMKMESNSIDAVVTDPPYGLKFMGKHWDYDVPAKNIWEECLRVLKPGGHLLSFFGTRTYHRGVTNIEDAGFEIRDQIQWLYGSGFPKSHDVSKAIDKAAGAEREVVGVDPVRYARLKNQIKGSVSTGEQWEHGNRDVNITSPSTDAAKQWQGWGSALKPANEPICVARKPLEKGLTLAQNVVKWGTGALNIDASRTEVRENKPRGTAGPTNSMNSLGHGPGSIVQGRWPANIILDETAAAMLDEQSGDCRSSGNKISKQQVSTNTEIKFNGKAIVKPFDSGGASRFFYVAKASKRERNAGLEGEVKQKQGARPNSADSSGKFPDHDHRETGGNNHPCVKPIKLMEYLIKLITPPQGVVLDPFAGSGSTGVAAKNLGFKFIGIEKEKEYCEIAQKRIEATA